MVKNTAQGETPAYLQEENPVGPDWLSPGWRKFFTVLLGIVFFLSFLAFTLGLAVRRDILSPTLYSEALAENNIYERVYTDLLADPAVQDQVAEITGIDIDLIVGEAYAQVVSALYLILPPARMQAATEQFFTSLTSYLSGETEQLEENLGLGAALTPEVLADHVVKAATAAAVEAIDKTTPIVERRAEKLVEEELVAYMDQISQGRLGPIPNRLLRTTVAGLSLAASEQLVDLLLGPAAETASDQTRLQIEAALAADDLPSAISFATTARLQLRVSDAITRAEPRLAETQALIGISGAAQAIGETRDSLVAGLNTVRGYAGILQAALIPLAIIMLVSLLLIGWLNSNSLRSALRAVGWTLFASSGVVLLVWLIAGFFLRSTLQSKLAAAQVGTASLDSMIDDVLGSLARGVWESVWGIALFWLILGLISLAFGYSEKLLAFLYRLLAPVWEYKWRVLAGLLGLFVLVPLVWNLFTADSRAANQPCNGHVELCDRPINEVAYATSHNSMSIAEYGWVWPMHDGTISEQLEAGVRALLIDTHYLDNEEAREEQIASLSGPEERVARRAINIFVPPDQDGTYMCHQLCGFGFTVLDDSLGEIKTFLNENPREVLFIVIQDEISSEDTEQAIEQAGLVPTIYSHQEGEPWPTLRELIDRNQRLIVMAENEGPPPEWYTNVWNSTEETPYTFVVPEQFNCEPNRGDTGKPFFLLNHWIQRGSPNRVDAAIVNEYDFLLDRAEQCAEERGQIPNFVAVNWYGQGDLFGVVDTLNGVDQGTE
ncbi:MAG: hypothetical protein U9R25_10710 [Chloroflexota bacterium]|nr:hypothetical protein [Chloroflexota bacterium]